MGRPGTHWTEVELEAAKALYDTGAGYHDIGDKIGRGPSAVYDMLRKRYGVTRSKPEYFDGPPIGKTVDCQRHEKDAKLGSQILREACLDLFQRTANRYQIRMDDAMACHLGYHAKPVIPGCERAIRGQFAMKRLAA